METEGWNWSDNLLSSLNNYWNFVHDGSLRGGQALEAVSRPLRGTRLVGGIRKLCNVLNEQDKDPFGYRCSTHLHMNVLDMDTQHLGTLGLITILSDTLLYQAGGGVRRGNYNCRPTSLVAEEVGQLARMLARVNEGIVIADKGPWGPHNRYLGTNWEAIMKFGSVEFRHFPGSRDPKKLFSWVELCLSMYTAAQERPMDEVYALAEEGAKGFAREIFGKQARSLMYQELDEDWVETLDTAFQYVNEWGQPRKRPDTLHGFMASEYLL